MIKQMAWNTFKNTGSIESCLELIQLENIEKNKNLNDAIKVEEYGNIKNQGYNCSREKL